MLKFGMRGETYAGEERTIEVEAGSSQAAFKKSEEACPGFRPERVVYVRYFSPSGSRRGKRPSPPGAGTNQAKTEMIESYTYCVGCGMFVKPELYARHQACVPRIRPAEDWL